MYRGAWFHFPDGQAGVEGVWFPRHGAPHLAREAVSKGKHVSTPEGRCRHGRNLNLVRRQRGATVEHAGEKPVVNALRNWVVAGSGCKPQA